MGHPSSSIETVRFSTRPFPLPDFAAFIRRPHHGRIRLAMKGLLEFRQVREWSIHPVFRDRMWIALHEQAHRLWTHGVSAELAPGDEELLLRREAVKVRRTRLTLHRSLKCQVSNLRSAEVSDTFAEN